MIPNFDGRDLLPPFWGAYPSNEYAAQSPYVADLAEVRGRFGGGESRTRFLDSLEEFRASLAGFGVSRGFQILGGSILERGREPNDLDVVTCFHRPEGQESREKMHVFVKENPGLFDGALLRNAYGFDANFVDLDGPDGHSSLLVARWVLRYSINHRDMRWRGVVVVPL